MHPARCWIAAAALALGACGGEEAPVPAALSALPASETYSAVPFAADVPAEFSAWVPLGGDTLAGISRQGVEVWTFVPGRPPARGPRLDPTDAAFAVAAARRGGEVGVLFGDGAVRTFALPGWTERAAHPPDARGDLRPRALLARPAGWTVAAEEIEGGRGSAGRRAFVRLAVVGAAGVAPFRRPQWTTETMAEGMLDVPALAGAGDTVWLAGGHPARVRAFDAALRPGAEDTLRDVPARRPSATDRAEIDRMLGDLPPGLRARMPSLDRLPPLRGIARVRGGFLVTATGPDGSVALDLYCNGRFARTVAEGADLRDAVVLPGALWLLREYEAEAEYRLERHDPATLAAACP